jgi:Uncharacterized conserved protein (DUF2075)
MGYLTTGIQKEGFTAQLASQTKAWRKQLNILKSACKSLIKELDHSLTWGILLEYPIPRRQKRIDIVLLARDVIFCIEFKTDATTHSVLARKQVEDYALDLRDFHDVSRDRRIVPIAVSTAADNVEHLLKGFYPDLVRPTLMTNATELARTIMLSFESETDPNSEPISSETWNLSAYHPVPTIIEAAEALYAQHDVAEIIHSHAGDQNIEITSQRIIGLVKRAQAKKEKIACFVTGIPGAGKTLVGLNVVHNPALREEGRNPGVFLSGNGPLVNVIRTAIERDFKRRVRAGNVKRETGTFIQNVHTFIKAESKRHKLSYENVIVFDEAQRAWDAQQIGKKIDLDDDAQEMQGRSEPEIVLSIMNRQKWAVVIALVGGGQEIHSGEAGIEEWGRALKHSFPRWRIAVSPHALKGGTSVAGHKLFEGKWPRSRISEYSSLHLNVNRRSFRAAGVTEWVEAVLRGESAQALKIVSGLVGFPVVLTRSVRMARNWLQDQARGLQRCGLVASSGGLRLRAEGLELSSGFRRNRDLYVNWFLNNPTDIRSSNQLEIAASEFECQGLELDWVGLCWSGDFTFDLLSRKWTLRSFKGDRWFGVRDSIAQKHLVNKYRVLLTRARRGMVIWVPEGDANDLTRPSEWFESTASFLQDCGLNLS